MQPDEPNDEERIEALDQDGQTPFQPADPNPSTTGNTTDPFVESAGSELPDDSPMTDSGIDGAELYDEGIGGAAEAEDNSGQSAVVGYDAATDQTTINDDDVTDDADDTSDEDDLSKAL